MPPNVGSLPPPSAAATTTFDDRRVAFKASDVQAAIEHLDLSLYALIAGDDAASDIRAATSYESNDGDAQAVISRAIADGARTLFLVGTCRAADLLVIDLSERIDLAAAPGSVFEGDLQVPSSGGMVRVDVPVTGEIVDPHRRVAIPSSIAATAESVVSDATVSGAGTIIRNIVSVTQDEYDNLTTPDPSTCYIIWS